MATHDTPDATPTTEPRKDPAPVPDRSELLGYTVNWAARLMGRAFARRLATVGASLGHWPVLLALLEHDGLTQAQLVRHLDLEQPTVANTLKRMQRDGLIRRVAHHSDRRQEHLHLTDQARALAPQMIALAAEVNLLALADLTADETRTLLDLLQRVIVNLRADASSP